MAMIMKKLVLAVMLLACLVVMGVARGAYVCEGYRGGTVHRNAVVKMMKDMAELTPNSPGFSYSETYGHVSGISRCTTPTTAQACSDCLAGLRAELTRDCEYSETGKFYQDDSSCAMSFSTS